MRAAALLFALAAVAGSHRARADPECRLALEVRLAPVKNVQMAVWIEDGRGGVVDTLYVTRSTGALGLGNRPGNPRLKGDYRFPYGSREMVLPVWAHARGKTYPRVTMGGPASVIDSNNDNDTVGYHFTVSSPEPFYCSPNGGVHRDLQGVDTVTCASPFYGSKGRYGDGRSVYPPRADLTAFTDHDSTFAHDFSAENDVAIVSGATPPGGVELAPPLRWMAPRGLPEGAYVVRVEVSLEADFNPSWIACGNDDPSCLHPTFLDEHPELRPYGRHVLGQPSLVWAVPITVDANARVATADAYQGYGSWDGSDGRLHAPDASISTDVDGSGQRRLLAEHDSDGTWRVKVSSSGCNGMLCDAPAAPTALTLTPTDTTITVGFVAPEGAVRPARYEVRYKVGGALTNENFAAATPGDTPPLPGPPSSAERFDLTGFKADSEVSVGVRAVAPCGAVSPTVFATTRTRLPQFATLHGCFVATAAYGSPLVREVETLRAFRDGQLLGNPMGRLAVAAYYGLGPSLAQAIATDRRLRALARLGLAPLVSLVRR